MLNKQKRIIIPLFSAFFLSAAFAMITEKTSQAITSSVNSTIAGIISLQTSSATVAVNVTPTGAGVQTINKDVVTISTNNSAGYTLKLSETNANNTLVSGSNTIAASSGTLTTPVVMAVNTWGYRVDGAGGFGATATSAVNNAAISGTIKFAAVPAIAAPDTIKTTAATASNDITNVWYGVAANTAVPSGAYTNSVTYTVTAN